MTHLLRRELPSGLLQALPRLLQRHRQLTLVGLARLQLLLQLLELVEVDLAEQVAAGRTRGGRSCRGCLHRDVFVVVAGMGKSNLKKILCGKTFQF